MKRSINRDQRHQLESVTVHHPRSVYLQLRDDRERKELTRSLGRGQETPIHRASLRSLEAELLRHVRECWSLMNLRIGSGSSSMTRPPSALTMPPPISASRRPRHAPCRRPSTPSTNQCVGVVSHRVRECSPAQTDVRRKTQPMRPTGVVAFPAPAIFRDRARDRSPWRHPHHGPGPPRFYCGRSTAVRGYLITAGGVSRSQTRNDSADTGASYRLATHSGTSELVKRGGALA